MEKDKKLWVLTNNVNDLENAGRFMDTINNGLRRGGEIISSGMAPLYGEPALWVFMVVPGEEQPAASDAEAWDWLEQEIQRRAYGSAPLANNVWQAAASLIGEARRRAGR